MISVEYGLLWDLRNGSPRDAKCFGIWVIYNGKFYERYVPSRIVEFSTFHNPLDRKVTKDHADFWDYWGQQGYYWELQGPFTEKVAYNSIEEFLAHVMRDIDAFIREMKE